MDGQQGGHGILVKARLGDFLFSLPLSRSRSFVFSQGTALSPPSHTRGVGAPLALSPNRPGVAVVEGSLGTQWSRLGDDQWPGFGQGRLFWEHGVLLWAAPGTAFYSGTVFFPKPYMVKVTASGRCGLNSLD
jgi:hypothetical protein